MGETADPSAAAPPASAAAAERSSRWHSLDVLKGLALFGLIAHHFQKWATGPVEDRFVGFDDYVVTDLAAPLFGVALGAAAVVVGSRVRTWGDLPAPALRWGQVLLVGIGIDLATHRFALRGTGVLPTLAILGFLITLAVSLGMRRPSQWWAASALCAVLAVPASRVEGEAVLTQLVNGPFALPVYGVFAAAGAAVATHGLGRSERQLPLLRAAAGVLAVGLVADRLAGDVVAPEGIWPPARYPGHLGFTLWGLVASFAIWAAARALLPAQRPLGAALGRAGRRTLFVFAAHFAVKIVLSELDLIGELDTRPMGLVVWGAVGVVCALSTLPRSRARLRHPG